MILSLCIHTIYICTLIEQLCEYKNDKEISEKLINEISVKNEIIIELKKKLSESVKRKPIKVYQKQTSKVYKSKERITKLSAEISNKQIVFDQERKLLNEKV